MTYMLIHTGACADQGGEPELALEMYLEAVDLWDMEDKAHMMKVNNDCNRNKVVLLDQLDNFNIFLHYLDLLREYNFPRPQCKRLCSSLPG
jgi:hypothetical protein